MRNGASAGDLEPMSEIPPLTPLNAEARLDQLFPTVTSEQLARISGQGTRRELRSGEVVYEAGAEEVPFVPVTKIAAD